MSRFLRSRVDYAKWNFLLWPTNCGSVVKTIMCRDRVDRLMSNGEGARSDWVTCKQHAKFSTRRTKRPPPPFPLSLPLLMDIFLLSITLLKGYPSHWPIWNKNHFHVEYGWGGGALLGLVCRRNCRHELHKIANLHLLKIEPSVFTHHSLRLYLLSNGTYFHG